MFSRAFSSFICSELHERCQLKLWYKITRWDIYFESKHSDNAQPFSSACLSLHM